MGDVKMRNKLLFGLFLLCVLVFSAYSVAAVGNSAGGLWKFDGNAVDTINGNNGVATGVTYGVGVDGQAAVFSNSIVTVPSISAYSFANGLTVEALVKLDATSHGYIIAQPGAFLLQVAEPEVNNPTFRFQAGLYKSPTGIWGSWIEANAPVQLGKWYYVAYTYDGSTAKLYVNGVLQKSMTYSDTPVLFSTNPVVIGNRATMDRALKGSLDNVEFTNRVKSAIEIGSRYTNLVQPTCIPKTCTALGKSCGSQDNGCGTQINCGSCSDSVCDLTIGMCVAELPGCKAYEDVVISQSVIIADSSDVACGLSVTKLFTGNGLKAFYADRASTVWLVGIILALLITFAFSRGKKRK
jgi:hypothetical protein